MPAAVNDFLRDHLCPFLNFHRPCLFPSEVEGPRGRIKKRYRQQDVATPYEKLKSLDDAESFLREGVTFEALDRVASATSGLQAARTPSARHAATSSAHSTPPRRSPEAPCPPLPNPVTRLSLQRGLSGREPNANGPAGPAHHSAFRLIAALENTGRKFVHAVFDYESGRVRDGLNKSPSPD